MGNMSSASQGSSHRRMYDQIKNLHDEAYKTIDEAITLEEQERPRNAIDKYKEGILLIDRCLDIPVTFPDNPDLQWENMCNMIQKMKKTRGEVLTRINCLQSSPNYVNDVPPPTYEEVIANEASTVKTYNELAVALSNIEITDYEGNAEIIYTHDNVQIYFISPGGEVLSTCDPQTLNIVLLENTDLTKPKAFLSVGEFVYPLVPGVSPCYRTNYGAFILPDVHKEQPGYSIGLILPSDADADVYELLENILHGIVNETPLQRPRSTFSKNVSQGLVTGAYYLSQGIIHGAKKTGDLINYGTPKIIDKIKPNTQSTELPKNVKKGIKFAQSASTSAALATGYVAGKVGLATTRLGQYLAPHIKKQGTRLLTSGFKLTESEASDKIDEVFTIAAGAIEGFSTIYRGLETSASILGDSLKNNTVKIVEHKYGNCAGESTGHVMDTVGNVWTISHNVKIFTPKGLVKQTAKQTGKAVVLEHGDNSENAFALGNPSTSNVNQNTIVKSTDIDKNEKDF